MHYMNPQRRQHMGAPVVAPQPADSGADMTKPAEGIGSAQSGYATPDNGPFECGNCIHFDGTNKCDNPQVVSDPEVNGQVEAEGCCNLFSPAEHEGGEDESGEEEGETGAIPGAGEGGQ
jgi:hypothetical protein